MRGELEVETDGAVTRGVKEGSGSRTPTLSKYCFDAGLDDSTTTARPDVDLLAQVGPLMQSRVRLGVSALGAS